jgi:hypothetical protein
MKVGDLDDAHAAKRVGEALEMQGVFFDAEFMAGNFSGIESYATRRGSGELEEGPAAEAAAAPGRG